MSSARALMTLGLAASLAACMQLVGADFGDVVPGDPNGVPDSSLVSLADDASALHDAPPAADAKAKAADATAPEGGPSIDDDGGTKLGDGSACPPSSPTTISGTVYDPAGKTPLYDVLVYIPTAPLAPLPAATCDLCGALPSGAGAITLSKADGTFTLSGDVPSGTDVPIVVQIGRWRRLAHVPKVNACAPNPLTDPSLTRLPTNGTTDGDMPTIAIATGQGDPVECVLYKMGIDVAEFTSPGGGGHIVLYDENGAYVSTRASTSDAGSQAKDLYSDPAVLTQYDQVLFGCEAQPGTKDGRFAQNLAGYANNGGRVWLEHYELDWLQAMPAPYPTLISFYPDGLMMSGSTITLDTSFPKGSALAAWMAMLGQTSGGTFSAPDTRADVAGTLAGQAWMTAMGSMDGGTAGSTALAQQVSFNTSPSSPASAQCGRMIFSDFHSGEVANTSQFPEECSAAPLTAEGYAMEFSLLDLGACILPDSATPSAP